MHRHPMSRNVNTSAHPHVLVLQNVVQKALQGGDTARPADQARVQTYGQHLGLIQSSWISLAVESIKSIAGIIKKLRARVETLSRCEAHVIAVQGVRHHQVWDGASSAIDRNLGPIRQIISIGIGVVEE